MNHKPILWLKGLNPKVKTPKDELKIMEELELRGMFLTSGGMGGCSPSYCGIEGVVAHFLHKEELIKYIYKGLKLNKHDNAKRG